MIAPKKEKKNYLSVFNLSMAMKVALEIRTN